MSLGKTIGETLAALNPATDGSLFPGLGDLFGGLDFVAKRIPWYIWLAAGILAISWWGKKKRAAAPSGTP